MTQRALTVKWLFYTLAALFLALIQSFFLQRIHIWGVHPFLLPCVPAIIASFESRRSGLLFAALMGFVCDLTLPAPFPGFYVVTLVLCALLSGFIARHAIMPGLPCTLLVSLLAMVFHGLFQTVLLGYQNGASFSSGLFLTLRETVVTLLAVIPAHPLLSLVHKRMANM